MTLTIDEDRFRQIIQDDMRRVFRQELETELSKTFGQMFRHFDARFDKFESKIDKGVNDVYNLIDGFTGRMDNEKWINELADHADTSLTPP